MQRINVLLNKISDLSRKADKIDLIEVDLMLDYTRVLYADLVELRNNKVYNNTTEGNIEQEREAPLKEQEATVQEEAIETTKPETIDKAPSIEPVAAPASTTQAHTSTQNIKKFIGINDKYQFISELFDNDTESYDKVITEINSFNTASKALKWLDNEVYEDRGWDENNDSVKMFYDTVSNFFASI